MKKKLTVEIAEGLGNQIFMYSFAYYISKNLITICISMIKAAILKRKIY